MRYMTSREFNQDTSSAKRAADESPVYITDRGRPAHVLLSIADYEALVGADEDLATLLAQPGSERIEFDPPRADLDFKPARLR